MRVLMAPLAAALLLLAAGCGDGGERAGTTSSEAAPSTPTARATPSPRVTVTIPPPDAGVQLAVDVCTHGMVEPDELMQEVVRAAREPGSLFAERIGTIQEAQAAVQELGDRATAGRLNSIGESMQDYSDALGRLQNSGFDGSTGIVDAREAIDRACLTGAYEASPS